MEGDHGWNCLELKVTKSLTVRIGIHLETGLIRVRSPKILPIEVQTYRCGSGWDEAKAEIFIDP